MSRSGFLRTSVGKAFLAGQQVNLFSWLCFVRCLLLPFFAFFFILVSYLKGDCVVAYPCRPFAKIKDRFKGKTYFFSDYYIFGTKLGQIQSNYFFLEITMFLEQKIDKIGTDSVL